MNRNSSYSFAEKLFSINHSHKPLLPFIWLKDCKNAEKTSELLERELMNMHILKKLNNEELVHQTKKLVKEERVKTLQVIEAIQEIYIRRVHLSIGYSSLHEFLVKECSYSDGSAYRRICAMHLIQDLPEAKERLTSGALTLSTATSLQNFFRSEKKEHEKVYSREEKLALMDQLNGASKERCEYILGTVSETYITSKKEIRVQEDEELKMLLEEYRMLSMQASGTTKEVLKSALKTAIESLKKNAIEVRAEASPRSSGRYISRTVRKAVWTRDRGRCQFVNPKTKLRCNATKNLEYDHIQPASLGGKSTEENIRLVCRAHNTLLALQVFGEKKIDQMIKNRTLISQV